MTARRRSRLLIFLLLGVMVLVDAYVLVSILPGALTGDPLRCRVPNLAWTEPGRLLRGGAPGPLGLLCLSVSGVDVLVDQRLPAEDRLAEAALAPLLGLTYINLGLADDTAPSPALLRGWIDTVAEHLALERVVLVHDAAGRGRMGVWDAVHAMRQGTPPDAAIENLYLAKALPFDGARIGCRNGGNGQVQALAEIAEVFTGAAYLPAEDEYGTAWLSCPRPAYMDGWDYAAVLP